MQGYLFKGKSNFVYAVTGRHKIERATQDDGTVCRIAVDGFAVVKKETVKLHRPGRPDAQVVVVEHFGDGDDRVVLRLQGEIPEVLPARTKPARVGQTVRAKYYVPATGKWMDVQGLVREVMENCVAYEFTTKEGCCRMAVFDSQGFIVAGHYFPGVNTHAGAVPGGHPEDGKIPKGWVKHYTLPRMVPQGCGKVPVKGPFQRVEKLKITPLRGDADLTWVKTNYVMAKPSTEMLHGELQKYFEPLPVSFDSEALSQALAATLTLDADASLPFRAPTLEDFRRVAIQMDNDRTGAGADAIGDSHREYLTDMGDGDLDLGIQRAAERGFRLYRVIVGEIEPSDEDKVDLYLMRVWCVQGKRDGYKPDKLFVGRSIQAPAFTFKLLHKAVFEESDRRWGDRCDNIRAGYDMDKPVPEHLVDIYACTLASIGLDESGFDRRMPREFMEMYFKYYLPFCVPGVPQSLVDFMCSCTVDSILLLTDGTMYEKDRGNPSGYPNTLRLNCTVQLMANCYALYWRLAELGRANQAIDIIDVLQKDIFLEICGDDSRANAQTDFGCLVLGAAEGFAPWLGVWTARLPWKVKIEGKVVFEHKDGVFSLPFAERMALFPPIVSRNLVVIDDIVWSPLWNADRCLRKLCSQGTTDRGTPHGRTELEEYTLVLSAFMTLKLQTYWHVNNVVFSPAIQFLMDNHWYTSELRRHVESAVAACYREGSSRRTPARLRQ